jgi:cobalt-zinc-cadmium efflux system outer membrane protein
MALAILVGICPRAGKGADRTTGGAKANVGVLLRDHEALVSWVRNQNGEVAASFARAAQAEAETSSSRLVPNPVFDASVNDVVVGPSNPSGLGWGDTVIYTVGVTQTIELGKRGPRSRAADLRWMSTRFAASGALLSKVAQARRALGHVVYLTAKQEILGQQLASAKAATELERVRFEQGAISGNDFERLVLDTTSLEMELSRSRAELEGALAQCGATLFAVCDLPGATLADVDHAAPLPSPLPRLEDLLEGRSDVQALALERDAARQEALLASRRALPDPAIRIGYTRDNLLISGDQGNTLSFGVVLPLPIFDRGQHDSEKARARAVELEWTREAAIRAAAADFEELASRRAFLEKGLEVLEKDAIPRSENILLTTNKAFDQGQVSLTDLLLARRTHIGLLLGMLDLKFDFFSVRSDLRRVLGLDSASSTPRGAP